MELHDILARSQSLEDAIGNLSRQLSGPDISDEYRAELESSLAGYRAEYEALQSDVVSAFQESDAADVVTQAFEAVYGNDEDRIQAAVDGIRADMADGKDFGDAFRDNISRDSGAASTPDNPGASDTDRDRQDAPDTNASEASSATQDDVGDGRIEMDERSRDALFNIFDGDEEKMQAAFDYLHEHYSGEGVDEKDVMDKIHDTLNYANRCDPESLGFESKEQAIGEKVAYDDRKVDYEATKGKYLFRNTFALGDKLAFNLEAYRTGLPGADGKPVTGGVLAMNIVELTRSNIIESFIEMALRDYFDKKYPAKEAQVDKGSENVAAEQGAGKDGVGSRDRDDTVKDSSGVVRDDGYATQGYEKADVGMDKDNPAAGVHYGADTSRGPMERDGVKVWSTDRPRQETYVDKTRDPGTDQTGKLRIPAMQLVEVQGNKYLVDPVGKATPVDISNPKTAYDLDINGQAYLRDFDVSGNRRGAEAVTAVAEGKGMSVEDYKATLSIEAKENYISKTMEVQEKHGEYLEKTAIPEAKETADAYREKIGQIEKYNEGLKSEISAIEKNYDGNQHKTEDVEKVQTLRSELGKNEALIEKFKTAADKIDSRVAAMEKSVESYKDAKTVVGSDQTDLDSRLSAVVAAEKQASGRTGEVDYGIGKEDAKDMAAAVERANDAEDLAKRESDTDVNGDADAVDGNTDSDNTDAPEADGVDADDSEKADNGEQDDADGAAVAAQDEDGSEHDNADDDKDDDTSNEGEADDPASYDDVGGEEDEDSDAVDAESDKSSADAGEDDDNDGRDSVTAEDDDSPEGHADAGSDGEQAADVGSDEQSPVEKELAAYREKAQEAMEGNFVCNDMEAKVSALEEQKVSFQEVLADLNGKRDPASVEYRESMKGAIKDIQGQIDSIKSDIATLDARSDVGTRLLDVLGRESLTAEQKLDAAHGFAESMGLTKDEIEQIRVDAGYSSDNKENNISSEQQQEARVEAEDGDKLVAADDNMRVEMQHLNDMEKDPSKAVEQNDPSKMIEQTDPSKAVEQNDPSKAVEQNDPSKAVEQNDPSKAVEGEGQDKQVDQKDPAQNVEQDDRDKASADENEQKIEQDANNQDVATEDMDKGLDMPEDVNPDDAEAQLDNESADDSALTEADDAEGDNAAEQALDVDGDTGADKDDDAAVVADADDTGAEVDGDHEDGPVDAEGQNEAAEGSVTTDEASEKSVATDEDGDEARVSGGAVSEQQKSEDDDAAVVSDNQLSKDDISAALDRYLEQGPEGTYSFEDDFLRAHAGEISQEDLYDAYKEKVAEVEAEIKSGEIDEDKASKMSDAMDSVCNYSIDHFFGQIERLADFIEGMVTGDFELAGNALLEDWLVTVESQLSPLARLADVVNEHFDSGAASDEGGLKESVIEHLENIGLSDNNIERIGHICDALENIFEGIGNLMSGMLEHFSHAADVDIPDAGVDITGPGEIAVEPPEIIMNPEIVAEPPTFDPSTTEVPGAEPDIVGPEVVPDTSPDFSSDFDISEYSVSDTFESFVDVLNSIESSVDAVLSGGEAEAAVEAGEAAAALLL